MRVPICFEKVSESPARFSGGNRGVSTKPRSARPDVRGAMEPTMTEDIAYLTLTDLVALYRDGTLSPVSATAAVYDRRRAAYG